MKQALLLVFSTFGMFTVFAQTVKFPPTPNEDTVNGRNDNCYLSAIDHPLAIERTQFIESIRGIIDSVCNKEKLPAKTILAMAIAESGYGFTRTAYYANNLFGIKVFTRDTITSYVLKGQPSEGVNNKAVKRFGENRIIFNESIRVDNRYRIFTDRPACIQYLVYKILLGRRYIAAVEKYRENIRNNILSEREASLQYAFDIAEKGYNHLGGKYYRKGIEKIFNTLNL